MRCYCGSSRDERGLCHHCDYPTEHHRGVRCPNCDRIAAHVFV